MSTYSRREALRLAVALGVAGVVPPGLAGPALATAAGPLWLTATTRTLDIGGRAATVLGLALGGRFDGLRLAAGDRFRVRLENGLGEDTLIHWHGLTPPWRQDGVPGVSAEPLPAAQVVDYDFAVAASGTYWMHSHLGLQEQRLLAAPLIVRSAADLAEDRQEVVILLHDFSFTPPEEIMARLTGGAMPGMDHGNMSGMDHGSMDHGSGMPGMAMDLNDVEHDAYLANDRTLADPEVVAVERGGRVRLRIINGAASTNFTVDLGGLAGRLAAVDGRAVRPVDGSRFPLAMAQRIDLLLDLPAGAGAWPVLAVREGARERTGIMLATTGAPVGALAAEHDTAGAVIGLELEQRLEAAEGLAGRAADRRLEIGLAGTMEGYRWSLEGVPADFLLAAGERVEIAMRNSSMMSHPMHLHGHSFQVVEIDGRRLAGAMRDTVLVPPGAAVTVAFDADNPGRWAFHCHHLYHMAAGMMATLGYAGVE